MERKQIRNPKNYTKSDNKYKNEIKTLKNP